MASAKGKTEKTATQSTAFIAPDVVTELRPIAAAIADLSTRYKGLVFDCQSSTGLIAARAARDTLIETRQTLELARKKAKARIKELGQRVEVDAEEFTAQIKALEDPIVEQIRAETARLEAEREKKRQEKEAAAKALQLRVDAIKGAAMRFIEAPAADVQAELTRITALDFPGDTEEAFLALMAARREAMTALSLLHQSAVSRETRAKQDEIDQRELEEFRRHKAAQAAAAIPATPEPEPAPPDPVPTEPRQSTAEPVSASPGPSTPAAGPLTGTGTGVSPARVLTPTRGGMSGPSRGPSPVARQEPVGAFHPNAEYWGFTTPQIIAVFRKYIALVEDFTGSDQIHRLTDGSESRNVFAADEMALLALLTTEEQG